MELEVMAVTEEERQLVEFFRAMTTADKQMSLAILARLSSQPVAARSPVVIQHSSFYCGDNSNNNSTTNLQAKSEQ